MDKQLQDRRILVVEDETLVALVIEDALFEAGAICVGVGVSVATALELIAQNTQLDAAVLDINLAGETSEPIAEKLATLGVPYLFATGYGRGVIPTGSAPVLNKPYSVEDLIKALLAICR